jgi:crotonobetainyl-CoA:carnitine CoA-transferase CaiB-like acyl-CoA transferase
MELRRPAPRLGEHTREVLAELGLASDEIDALASRRVIP